jgi:predicted nucleotidyltransferase
VSALTERQERVARGVVEQEQARRDHLVIAVSGAHAYGFPSPDSDVDLKAIHVTSTDALLGLRERPRSASRLETIDGVEIDYSSNEIGPALAGVLGGNGNYAERLLGVLTMHEAPELEELRPLVRQALSRRMHRHYRGFAHSQLQAFRERATAKKALYVLRTALTGAHLLATGELVADLTRLMDAHGFGHAAALIERKQQGERVGLEDAERDRWLAELDRAFNVLDEAERTSPLAADPSGDELDAWLVAFRRRR